MRTALALTPEMPKIESSSIVCSIQFSLQLIKYVLNSRFLGVRKTRGFKLPQLRICLSLVLPLIVHSFRPLLYYMEKLSHLIQEEKSKEGHFWVFFFIKLTLTVHFNQIPLKT